MIEMRMKKEEKRKDTVIFSIGNIQLPSAGVKNTKIIANGIQILAKRHHD
jgi:hypothetical protein